MIAILKCLFKSVFRKIKKSEQIESSEDTINY